MKQKNEFVLRGAIVGLRASSRLTQLRIATDGGDGRSVYPTIVFYDVDKVTNYKVGDRVTINGHVQSRTQKDSKGNVLSYNQDLVGDTITPTKRMLAEYVDEAVLESEDGGYPPDGNVALIFGKVTHIFSPREDITLLTIGVRKGRMTNFCEVTCFKRQAEFATLLSEGDDVAVAGAIRTIPNKKDGGKTLLQSVVCKDLAKITGLGDEA